MSVIRTSQLGAICLLELATPHCKLLRVDTYGYGNKNEFLTTEYNKGSVPAVGYDLSWGRCGCFRRCWRYKLAALSNATVVLLLVVQKLLATLSTYQIVSGLRAHFNRHGFFFSIINFFDAFFFKKTTRIFARYEVAWSFSCELIIAAGFAVRLLSGFYTNQSLI